MRANPTRMWERWRDAADAHQWSVVIGNVGTVITTTLESAARNTYDEYVTISMNGSGRAAHEEVTLLRDGDIISNHQPLPHSDDLDDDEIDEMVHEAFAVMASDVNNGGREAQVRFLIARGFLRS